MAQGRNPPNSDHTEKENTRPVKNSSEPVPKRFFVVTFAAALAFLLAGFQATWAIVEFVNVAWIGATTYGTFDGYLWIWAVLDLLIAAVYLYAGYVILSGGRFGYIYGVIIASISAVRWFFYLPAAPLLGVLIIAIDIFIIYGLTTNAAYFRARSSA